jgi:predicted transposase/invertase (TIGR01784 family)
LQILPGRCDPDEGLDRVIHVKLYLNPYNEREFLDDKLSIVAVKARDQAGRLYQSEIQLHNIPDLPARILYGWADFYSAQLQDGDGYDQLQPTYAIWLLGQALWPQRLEAVHRFRLRDDCGRSLVEHGGIWLLELSKCAIADVETEQERWLKFFTEGHQLDPDHLPQWMQTAEMRQAMDTLKAFSDQPFYGHSICCITKKFFYKP